MQDRNRDDRAMAFYHPDGLVAAWRQAALYAGDGGRGATLPDIVDARMSSPRSGAAWRSYFTTTSSEFYGLSRSGTPVVAVLHGSGPLATLEGCLAAYGKDAEGRRRTGRVSRDVFLAVLDGRHGEVHSVDWRDYVTGRDCIDRYVTGEGVGDDAWACARFGGRDRALRYAAAHARFEGERLEENGHTGLDPMKRAQFRNEIGNAAPYLDWSFSKGGAVATPLMPADPEWAHANLLSIGGLFVTGRFEAPDRHDELPFDMSPHEWNDGTRLAGLRGGTAGEIHPGLDIDRARRELRPELIVKATPSPGFDLVMRHGDGDWIAYPKSGTSMDSGEPMSRVTSLDEIGSPVTFETEPSGYYGFFKYNLADVRRLAPSGSNAYRLVSEPAFDGNRNIQSVDVQFLRIEAERGLRLLKREEIYRNPALVLALAAA